jgi:hypothetical protein
MTPQRQVLTVPGEGERAEDHVSIARGDVWSNGRAAGVDEVDPVDEAENFRILAPQGKGRRLSG